jgi:hypothetical protein
MTSFEKALLSATEMIEEKYFLTKITQANGGEKSVYRERIYCYELYHQIKVVCKDVHMNIFAEYDKSGSSFYAGTSLSRVKPDFLLHHPGNTKNNHIAMEVKSSAARRSDLQKDIEKLIKLTDDHGFKFGVYLIYGKDAIVKGNIANEYIENTPKIKIFTHDKAGTKAVALNPDASI